MPHHFRLRTGEPFAFAGVWDRWAGAGAAPLLTCAVITVPANDVVRPVHDRMPAVLRPDQYAAWLDPRASVPDLLGLLAPLPAELMEGVPVGQAVNRVVNDGLDCVAAAV